MQDVERDFPVLIHHIRPRGWRAAWLSAYWTANAPCG